MEAHIQVERAGATERVYHEESWGRPLKAGAVDESGTQMKEEHLGALGTGFRGFAVGDDGRICVASVGQLGILMLDWEKYGIVHGDGSAASPEKGKGEREAPRREERKEQRLEEFKTPGGPGAAGAGSQGPSTVKITCSLPGGSTLNPGSSCDLLIEALPRAGERWAWTLEGAEGSKLRPLPGGQRAVVTAPSTGGAGVIRIKVFESGSRGRSGEITLQIHAR